MAKNKHLSPKERDEIYVLLQSGIRNRSEIGRSIGRPPSTIKREIERNKVMIGILNNNNPEAKKDPDNYYYLPDRAQAKYMKRRKDSKPPASLKTFALREFLIDKIKHGWGPELAAGRAKELGIGSISAECIYQFIYGEGRDLKLWEFLPRAHKKRRKYNGRKGKRTLIPNRVGIEHRPESVADREEFGHWEDDSIVGVGIGSALNTKRERKSRYMMITKIPRKTARYTRIASVRRFKELPLFARLTDTADNGPEFTEHEKITKQTQTKFYFATPYHSWERGTNENGNGLVRRFFPKKTDFNHVTPSQIKAVEDWINHRPLKCLNYKTPHEVFHEELNLYRQSSKNS